MLRLVSTEVHHSPLSFTRKIFMPKITIIFGQNCGWNIGEACSFESCERIYLSAQAYDMIFESVAETMPSVLHALVLSKFKKLKNILSIPQRIPAACQIQWLEVNDSNEDLEQVAEPIELDGTPRVTHLLKAGFTKSVKETYLNFKIIELDYKITIDEESGTQVLASVESNGEASEDLSDEFILTKQLVNSRGSIEFQFKDKVTKSAIVLASKQVIATQ